MSRVRWYNRLAAWLYEFVANPLIDLALPVWNEQAEIDAEEEYEAFTAELDAAYDAGYDACLDDGVSR